MNEYIKKQELVEQIEHERDMWGEDYDAEQILGDIEDMQAYTQADLESLAYDRGAREFAQKIKEELCKKDSAGCLDNCCAEHCSGDCFECEENRKNVIDNLLKEMGCE